MFLQNVGSYKSRVAFFTVNTMNISHLTWIDLAQDRDQ
jgi:hypothetical protein